MGKMSLTEILKNMHEKEKKWPQIKVLTGEEEVGQRNGGGGVGATISF